MGKSGSGTATSKSGPTKTAKAAMTSQYEATLPILQLLSKQIVEALSTGGVNARIPIMQRVVEAARKAASDTMRGATDAVARSGVGQYGRQFLEGVKGKGEFDVSQAALQVIQSLLGQAPDYGMMRGSPIWGNATQSKSTSTKEGATDWTGLSSLFKVGTELGKGGGASLAGQTASLEGTGWSAAELATLAAL